MADGQSMRVADVVAQVRDGRLEDFVREGAVALVVRGLMDAEIGEEIGAGLGEIAARGPRPTVSGSANNAYEGTGVVCGVVIDSRMPP